MLSNRLYKTSLLATLFIFAFSTFTPALTYAAPLSVSDKDWERVNGNSWAQNNSPQTQINSGNVDQLEVKWMFPIPGVSTAPAWLGMMNPREGTLTPPIVKNGIVYVTTEHLRTIAIDAETGRQVWNHQYEANLEELGERLPINLAARNPHLHGIRYWATEDAVIVPGLGCNYEVIDAKSGETKYEIGPFCADVPGSIYNYVIGYAQTLGVADLGTYEKGRIFIGAAAGNLGGFRQAGRSFAWGIDMDQPDRVIWRVFWQPPQDRPVNDWALQECSIGWFYTIPCSQVREQAPDNLMNDWQYKPGQTPHWSVATSAAWGETIVDEDTGYVYMATGNSSPYPTIGVRPGPNLYSETLMAIDASTGRMVWWVQDAPRDPWDYDCNWSGMLIDDATLGKVYVKGCKIGFLHVRDALTGEPIHWIDTRAPGQYDPRMGNLRSDLLGTKSPLNPLSEFEMKEFVERNEYQDLPYAVNPIWAHGSFGSDAAYNDGTVFHYVISGVMWINEYLWPENLDEIQPEGPRWRTSWSGQNTNTTLVARDLVTGEVKWMYYYDATSMRAFPTVTGNMVIMPCPDGYMRFVDEDTGELLREMNLGGPMQVGATVGKDSAGDSKIFVTIGNVRIAVGLAPGPNVPGTLVALGLSERAAAEVRTTTVTTTSITTRTLTTTSATTLTITSATTVTSTTTAPAQTVTATQEVSVGLPAEVTYAAVAVAVIAILAAAVLATRRR